MASTIVFVLAVLSLVLGASFSLPIYRDGETVQSTKSLSESDVTGKTTALYTETVLSLDEEIKPVPSFSTETVLKAFPLSFQADHVKRIKREMVKPGQVLCPSDKIEFHGRCLTKDEYDEIGGDDYEAES